MDHAEPTQSINNDVKPSEHTDLGKPKGGIVEKKVSFYCRDFLGLEKCTLLIWCLIFDVFRSAAGQVNFRVMAVFLLLVLVCSSSFLPVRNLHIFT